MAAATLSVENLGDGRALFLYRLGYTGYLYSLVIGMLVPKEGTLIQCLCQPKGLTKEILLQGEVFGCSRVVLTS